jgi:hypothetical protein
MAHSKAQALGSFWLRAALVALAFAVALGGSPRQAKADASQLCRAGSNLVLAPFDALLGPYIAAKDEYYGLTEIDDETSLKVAAAAPGYVFLLGMQVGGSIIRLIAGAFEIIPGMVTLFREEPQPPLFRSAEDAWSIWSEQYGPCPVKLGISYNTINDG